MSEHTTKRSFHAAGDDHWSHREPDRVLRGANAPGAKLSEAQIARLCEEFAGGSTNKSWLARKYGVDRVTIWRQLKKRGLV